MTPYERLMAEAIPTGTFGHARRARHRSVEPAPAWTPEEQAEHRAVLDAELDAYDRRQRPPHLRVIDGRAA